MSAFRLALGVRGRLAALACRHAIAAVGATRGGAGGM